MNKTNNNGLMIVGGILAILVIIRTVQLIILFKHKCYRPCKPLKNCKDVVIADYDDDFNYSSNDGDDNESFKEETMNKETTNKKTINKEV